MKVRILNWDSHQERADRGNYIWFKFYNKFWEDEKIHALSLKGKVLFIYLLTLCSKASSDTVDLILPIATVMTGLREFPLNELSDAGLVDCQEKPVTARQEENRIEENRIPIDLESVYQLYPKRPNQEKKRGMGKLAREVKTQEDFDQLKRAVCNYAKYCEAECVQPKYVKQFATFASGWREWVTMDPPLVKKGDWHG